MRGTSRETPGDNRERVIIQDPFANQTANRRDAPCSSEVQGAFGGRINLDYLRLPIWSRQRLWMFLTLFVCLVGGGLVFSRICFPQPGRIYHVPDVTSTLWTEKDAEDAFGSPGRLVYGSPGSPHGYAKEWKGKGAYCLMWVDGSGRCCPGIHKRPATIFEEIAAFFGLPEFWN
jgi:hypothetical protein